jgi:hypothetical protein
MAPAVRFRNPARMPHGSVRHYDGAHNHPVNRALHMIAIPVGFSSPVLVWFHSIIGLLLIPLAATPHRPACLSRVAS